VKDCLSQGDQPRSTDPNYSAKLSVDISGKSQHEIDRVLADMQNLAKLGTKGNVNINIASSQKCDHSVTTVQTPTTTITTCETIETPPSISINSMKGRRHRKSSGYCSSEYDAFTADKNAPNRKPGRKLLLTPTGKIVKKLRKATGRVLRRKSGKKRIQSQQLGDEVQLLPKEEGFFDQGFAEFSNEPDYWFVPTSFISEEAGNTNDPFLIASLSH
jgi:hypothetical protein